LPQYLNKFFSHLFVAFSVKELRESRIAIDTGIFMHRFTENMHYPLEYVDRFLEFAAELRRAAINFVFVFDGIAVVSKSRTLVERRHKRERNTQDIDRRIAAVVLEERILLDSLEVAVTSGKPPRYTKILEDLQAVRLVKMRLGRKKNPVNRKFFYNLEQVFSSSAIPYLVADQEAEMGCAWLARKGFVDIVVTDDYDAVVCGAPLVLRRWKQKGEPCVIELRKLLGELGVSHSQFVDTCVLAGSDFAKPPMYYGFRRALFYVQTMASECGTTDENLLAKTFDKYYLPAYRTKALGIDAFVSFSAARKIFLCTAFPFSRSLLIFTFLFILRLIIKALPCSLCAPVATRTSLGSAL
jgi:5'-3' exonuclease